MASSIGRKRWRVGAASSSGSSSPAGANDSWRYRKGISTAGSAGRPNCARSSVNAAGDVMPVAVRRAAGVGPHDGVRHVEELGGHAPAVLGCLADDEIGTPCAAQREQVGHGFPRRVAGEDGRPRPRVPLRAQVVWRPSRGRHGPCPPPASPVPTANASKPAAPISAGERCRRSERHLMTPSPHPGGDREQRVEVPDPRLRREQDSHHIRIVLRFTPRMHGERLTSAWRSPCRRSLGTGPVTAAVPERPTARRFSVKSAARCGPRIARRTDHFSRRCRCRS